MTRFDIRFSDDEGDSASDVQLGLLGVHCELVQLNDEQWRANDFIGDPQPLMIMRFDTQVFGESLLVSLPPIMVNVDAAALLISGMRTEFDRAGVGAQLTAALDQVAAQVRDIERPPAADQ